MAIDLGSGSGRGCRDRVVMAAVVVCGPSENKPRVSRCRGREEQYPEHLACDLRRSRVCRVPPEMVRAFADLSADPLLPARAGKGDSMTARICFRCLVRGLQSMIRNGAWFRETGGQAEESDLTEHWEPGSPWPKSISVFLTV